MASVSDHGDEWNTQEAFSKDVAELHAVELLRPGARQQPLHTGLQGLLTTPWGYDSSQFVGNEEEIPTGGPKLPIEFCAFDYSQRAPLIDVVFALRPDRTQKRGLLDEDGAGLNRVRDKAPFLFRSQSHRGSSPAEVSPALNAATYPLVCDLLSVTRWAARLCFFLA